MTTATAPIPARRFRRLVLVDIENLSGRSPRLMSAEHIADLITQARRSTSPTADDVVLVACNPAWRFSVRGAWPDAMHRSAGGPDGADLALCDAATSSVLVRFEALWIVSGDGRLAEPARRARDMGLPVTVLSRRRSLSMSLRRVADRVVGFHWRPPSIRATPPNRSAA